jgi:hypothetical protein
VVAASQVVALGWNRNQQRCLAVGKPALHVPAFCAIFIHFKEKLAIGRTKAHMEFVTSSGLGVRPDLMKVWQVPSNLLPVPSHGWAVAMVGP